MAHFHPLTAPVGTTVRDATRRPYVRDAVGFVRTNADATTTRLSPVDMNNAMLRGVRFDVRTKN